MTYRVSFETPWIELWYDDPQYPNLALAVLVAIGLAFALAFIAVFVFVESWLGFETTVVVLLALIVLMSGETA